MADRLKTARNDELFKAVLELRTVDECYRFFEDLCTVAEIKSMSQRWEVAKKLTDGDSYADIAKITGASTATISRVKRYLNYGADGYKLILQRLKKLKK